MGKHLNEGEAPIITIAKPIAKDRCGDRGGSCPARARSHKGLNGSTPLLMMCLQLVHTPDQVREGLAVSGQDKTHMQFTHLGKRGIVITQWIGTGARIVADVWRD